MLNLSFNFIKKTIRNIFPFYKNRELKFIFNLLHQGFPKEKVVARFVGGCVRKYLSGEKIDDIDVATILTVDEIKDRLSKTNLKVIDTGLEHGTITVISKKFKLEITTLRKDIKTDGRHAIIKYTDDWQLDSERRDITINAIYLDINGKIFDPQMGTTDLKNKNVKFIGDPQKRIEEDYLRIIRFIRFKIMYDLRVEKTTIDAIKQNLDGIKQISKERVLIELYKILELKGFLNISESSDLKEIFRIIFPEFLYIDRLKRFKKVYNLPHIDRNILLAVLLIDNKANHEYFFHKYKISKKIQIFLEKISLNLKKLESNRNFFYFDLLKNIYKNGKNHMIALNLVNYSTNSKITSSEFSKLIKNILKSKVPKFHINGDYLKRNGMKEGTSLGKVLTTIENEWIENRFKISNNRVKELIKLYSN